MRHQIVSSIRTLARAGVHSVLGAAYRIIEAGNGKPDRIRKVLVSAYTGLGHFVIRTVLIQQIEQLYPQCEVAIIAGNSYGTEYVLTGYRTFILKQESGALRKILFFWRLRREKFDAVFLPFDASPKFLVRGCILTGIPIRIGHVFEDKSVPSYYYTKRVPVRISGTRSEIDLNLDLLEALYGKPFPRMYRPAVDTGNGAPAPEQYGLSAECYICIQIGAANGLPTTKRWLESHFRELIARLLTSYPEYAIVAVGDRGDAPIVNRICDGIASERLKNLSGRIGLSETKKLIAHCRFLICHDSGLLHLGNALGKRVVALYGPSDPDQYAVNTPTCHILREPCHCTPRLGLFPGRYSADEAEAAMKCHEPDCMRRLTVERVYTKCAELLDGQSTPPWQ